MQVIYVTLIFLIVFILFLLFLLLRRSGVQQNQFRPQELDPFKISIEDIDKMEDGSEFEMYLYQLFYALGYESYKTVGSRDFGADLVFTDREGVRNVVQAKRYSYETNPVGIDAVQQVFSSMRFYKAARSMVISSGRYTDACETLAGVNGVKLLDRKDMITMIELFKSQQFDQVKDIIESEARMIYESWSEYKDNHKFIKKDYKADSLLKTHNQECS